jgi:hypothetical protein
MELLRDVVYVDSRFSPFRDSVQDGCMVHAKRTIGLEILLDTFDGTPS